MGGHPDPPGENPTSESNIRRNQEDEELTQLTNEKLSSTSIPLTRKSTSSSIESDFNDEELKEGFHPHKSKSLHALTDVFDKGGKETSAVFFRDTETKLRIENDMLIEKFQKLQKDYEKLNLYMGDLKKSINEKEDIIIGQREIIEKHDEQMAKLVANNEIVLKQKEDEVTASRSDSTAISLIRPANVNDMFKVKSNGKSAKNIDINNFKCENKSCNMLGVDCIKCSGCLKWICETCHGVPVSKCKPIFNKCKSIYFMCSTCEESAYLNKIKINNEDYAKESNKKANDSIDDKLSKFATELVGSVSKLVDDKLSEKLNVWNSKLKSIEKLPEEINQKCATFKDALTKNVPAPANNPVDFRRVLLETQNEEKIQQSQRDARSKNIIIHGIAEADPSDDTNIIKELTSVLDCGVTPSSIIRVGKKKEQGSRPLKIIMSTVNDKECIMGSLGKLKNAPDNLRRISVTDDYTQEERESIRQKVAEAKQMTETKGEGKYIWRVRGTPKNGLILRRFNVVKNQDVTDKTATDVVVQAATEKTDEGPSQ